MQPPAGAREAAHPPQLQQASQLAILHHPSLMFVPPIVTLLMMLMLPPHPTQELVLSRYLDSSLPELPGGALQQLTRLRISGSRWLRELHPSWCALPALLVSRMQGWGGARCARPAPAGGRRADMPTACILCSHAPHTLQSFEIESCERLRRLPAELTTLTGLQRIRFGWVARSAGWEAHVGMHTVAGTPACIMKRLCPCPHGCCRAATSAWSSCLPR